MRKFFLYTYLFSNVLGNYYQEFQVDVPVGKPVIKFLRKYNFNKAYVILSFSFLTHYNVELKRIDCQLFFQQKWVYLGSANNWNSGSSIMVRPMQVPSKNGKDNSFIEGERELGELKKGPWLLVG